MNRPDLAFADFNKAIEIDPTNHAPYFNVGDLFYRAGRLSDALEFYDKGIALKPDIPDIYCQRGRLLQQMNREDEAWDSYGRELARDPGNDCALYGYTKIAQERHEEGKAIAAFDRALEANQNDAESDHRRGTLYFDLGQYATARSPISITRSSSIRGTSTRCWPAAMPTASSAGWTRRWRTTMPPST